MALNGVASAVLVIWFVVSSLAIIGFLGVIAFTLMKLQAKLEQVTEKVDPLFAKTDALLSVADEKLRVVGEKAETLLATGEEIASTVQDRVDKTTGTVQRTVNAPLIEANAVASGLTHAWQTFTGRTQKSVRVISQETKTEAETENPQKQRIKMYGG